MDSTKTALGPDSSTTSSDELILDRDVDVTNFELTEAEAETVAAETDRLAPLVEKFPTRILHVNLTYNHNSEEYEVRLALVLPGQTFATGGVGDNWMGLLENATTKLIHRVEHYQEDLENVTDRRHHAGGHDFVVEPTMQIDADAVNEAIQIGSYSKFRAAVSPFDPSLRDRIGRWVQRYPRVNEMIGEKIFLADITEEVFLMAFDQFDQWTPEQRFGQWLETLVDPAVKAIARDPEGELEAIRFQLSWQEADE